MLLIYSSSFFLKRINVIVFSLCSICSDNTEKIAKFPTVIIWAECERGISRVRCPLYFNKVNTRYLFFAEAVKRWRVVILVRLSQAPINFYHHQILKNEAKFGKKKDGLTHLDFLKIK